LSANTIWPQALEQLQRQMTRATFEQWLQHTRLLDHADGVYRIAVQSEQAQEWLQHRLRETVERTLANLVGEPVSVEFVVAAAPVATPPDPTPAAGPPTGDDPSLLSQIDYQQLWNSTGFIKLDHYANIFWRRYLGRAFDLWLYLQSKPMSRHHLAQGWTPSKKFRFRELARALKASVNSIKGAEENCYYLRLAADLGQPFSDCCGRFQEVRWEPALRQAQDEAPRCMHWRTGWLEILFAEKLLAVEEIKSPDKPRSHSLKLQVWRILPLLTPWQVGHLSEVEQERHDRWVERYGHLAQPPVSLEAWEAETAPTLVPLMTSPPYDLGRTNFDVYQPNTLKASYCIHEDAIGPGSNGTAGQR